MRGSGIMTASDPILDWLIKKLEAVVKLKEYAVSQGASSKWIQDAQDIRAIYYAELADDRIEELKREKE